MTYSWQPGRARTATAVEEAPRPGQRQQEIQESETADIAPGAGVGWTPLVTDGGVTWTDPVPSWGWGCRCLTIGLQDDLGSHRRTDSSGVADGTVCKVCLLQT